MYGKELILDIHDCDKTTFTRESLAKYFRELCELMDIQRDRLCWLDYKNCPEEYEKRPAHLKGISAVQFIKTFNITIHVVDLKKMVLLNIFLCKDFDENKIVEFSRKWFDGKHCWFSVVGRGVRI